jgi:DNA-binding transcriptional LysR family regulator
LIKSVVVNIKALRAFRLIVIEGSLAAAARRMNLSASAVSRLISLLETELKLALFHRTRRSLALTREGEAFYRDCQRILAGFEELPRIAANIRSMSPDQFRIVTAPRIAHGLVSPALTLMHEHHPQVTCSVDLQPRYDLETRVGTRQFDIGLVSLPVLHSLVEIESCPLFRVRAEALLPETHELADRAELSAEELAAEPLIGPWPGQIWRHMMDDFFQSGGTFANYAIETRSSHMACQLVRDGAGITILDRLSAQAVDLTGIAIRPLVPERWTVFGYVYPVGARPNENSIAFLECLREVIGRFRSRDPENEMAVVELLPTDHDFRTPGAV